MKHYERTREHHTSLPWEPEESAAIELVHFSASYGGRSVLHDLSFTVPRGSIFGLLGTNGAGKTTTIKTLLGFRPPQSGVVRVLGYEVGRQQQAINALVGSVSEQSSLYDGLTVAQLCRLSSQLQRRWNQPLVQRFLDLFALPAHARLKTFSRGMRSQVALCLALGHEPELLILDEPTAGLDPLAHQVVLSTLIGEVAARGTTIFFATQQLAEVEAMADQVAVLHGGRLSLYDEVDQLRTREQFVRLVYAQQPPAEEMAYLRGLPDVLRVEQEGRAVRLRMAGEAQALVALLQARPYALRDHEVVAVPLAEVLLTALRGEGA
ncbi:ABC transporter ATP-binding protein [Ktedonosporobacter rubrisoli]|uniref:ABC transporter ATP-binding protein n=1 Tax=Ktedonosporobacter rubrisoli TaxID=2509675 RepID=A0A4P6JPZ5_KTERU|nr:ABC transporter ATP-binding protein [Ktedonosporobacter rubrisoli]QBD77375.1 ABC transporter ATP-binding protein [Ktedonosporobacter rubrisoli]